VRTGEVSPSPFPAAHRLRSPAPSQRRGGAPGGQARQRLPTSAESEEHPPSWSGRSLVGGVREEAHAPLAPRPVLAQPAGSTGQKAGNGALESTTGGSEQGAAHFRAWAQQRAQGMAQETSSYKSRAFWQRLSILKGGFQESGGIPRAVLCRVQPALEDPVGVLAVVPPSCRRPCGTRGRGCSCS